jgi:hypothetical protein
MTTGGIARREVAEQVLAGGVALVGMATALAVVPDLPAQWRAGRDGRVTLPKVEWKDQVMAALARMALVKRRLRSLGRGATAPARHSPLVTLIIDQLRTGRLTKRYRRWARQTGVAA